MKKKNQKTHTGTTNNMKDTSSAVDGGTLNDFKNMLNWFCNRKGTPFGSQSFT